MAFTGNVNAGVTGYRRIQAGREGTTAITQAANDYGTSAAASTYLYGTMQFTPNQEFYMAENEERNSMAEIHRVTAVSRFAEMRFEGSLQFQTFHHFLMMGMRHDPISVTLVDPATGVLQRIWHPNLTNRNLPRSYTIRYGDNFQAYQSNLVIAKSLEISLEMNDAVMLSADLIGRFPVKSAASTGYTDLSQQRVDDAIGQNANIYVTGTAPAKLARVAGPIAPAAVSGYAPAAVAANLQSGLISAASITMPTGFEMVRYATGEIDFSDFSEMKRSWDLDLTMRHHDDGLAEYVAYEGTDIRYITVDINGQDFTAGGNTSTRNVQFNLAMLYIESPQLFQDGNGDNLFSMRGKTIHDPTWDQDFTVSLTSEPYGA